MTFEKVTQEKKKKSQPIIALTWPIIPTSQKALQLPLSTGRGAWERNPG